MLLIFKCEQCIAKKVWKNDLNLQLEPIEQFIEEHKKPFLYNYNENVYGYTNKGRVIYRYGDKVIVQCIGSDPEKREIDFALVRKA